MLNLQPLIARLVEDILRAIGGWLSRDSSTIALDAHSEHHRVNKPTQTRRPYLDDVRQSAACVSIQMCPSVVRLGWDPLAREHLGDVLQGGPAQRRSILRSREHSQVVDVNQGSAWVCAT